MQSRKFKTAIGFVCFLMTAAPLQSSAAPPTSDAKVDALILMLLGYHDGSPKQFTKLDEGVYSLSGDGPSSLQFTEIEPCVFRITSLAVGQTATTVTFHAALIDAVTYSPVGADRDGPVFRYSLKVEAGPGLQTDATGASVHFFERSTVVTDKTLVEMQANAEFVTKQACPHR